VTPEDHDIVQHQVTQKWYKTELYLNGGATKRKSYMSYQIVPFSGTLNDPTPDFNGMALFNFEYLRNSTMNALVKCVI